MTVSRHNLVPSLPPFPSMARVVLPKENVVKIVISSIKRVRQNTFSSFWNTGKKTFVIFYGGQTTQ